MKHQKASLLLAGFFAVFQAAADCCNSTQDCTGGCLTNHTYFADRIGHFMTGGYMLHSLASTKRMSLARCGWGTFIQVVPFGGQTSDAGNARLAKWFGLNYQSTVVVTNQMAGAAPADNVLMPGADIDAYHFNIRLVGDAPFVSTIRFCPQQRFYGVGIDWKQSLWRNTDDTVRVYGEIVIPIQQVENSLNFTEQLMGSYTAAPGTGLSGQPYVASVSQAFQLPFWTKARMFNACGPTIASSLGTIIPQTTCGSNSCECSNCMAKSGIADLELKIGYNFVKAECCFLNSYAGIVCPTGNQPCGTYVFEPIVGNGKHWGFMWGSEIEFIFWKWDCASIGVHFVNDTRYLFASEEWRTFDLRGKPWSRYQALFADATEAAAAAAIGASPYLGTLGANLTTRCLSVLPRGQTNLTAGLTYESSHLMLEIGINFYARQDEQICPNWTIGSSLRGAPNGTNVLTKERTIRDNFRYSNLPYSPANYALVTIQSCDVDWQSGAHPQVFQGAVYGTLGFQWLDLCHPTMVTLGGAYEFSSSNAAMTRWTAFGKLGISF